MKQTEEERLYDMLKNKSDDELRQIINDNGYGEITKNVAKTILNSNRPEHIKQQETYENAQRIENEKKFAQYTNPLYDDIQQIAGDVRFIKNFIIISVIIAVVIAVVAILTIHNMPKQFAEQLIVALKTRLFSFN